MPFWLPTRKRNYEEEMVKISGPECEAEKVHPLSDRKRKWSGAHMNLHRTGFPSVLREINEGKSQDGGSVRNREVRKSQ